MAGIVRRSALALAGATRAGLRNFYGRPGWAGQVSPFEYGTVTPGAVALKSLASFIYGRRAAENAREQSLNLATERRVREAQIAELEARAAAAGKAKVTRPYKVPGVGVLNLTDEQAAAHAGQIAPKPEPRVHLTPEHLKQLGLTADETGSVPQRDYSAAAAKWLHDEVDKRVRDLHADVTTRALNQQHAANAAKSLKELTDNEERLADEEAASWQMHHEAAGRILQNPDASVTLRRKAARMLMAAPATFTTTAEPGKAQPLMGPAGQQLYDTEKLPDLIKAATASRRADALARIRRQNAAKRAALESVSASMTGADTGDAEYEDRQSSGWLQALESKLDQMFPAPSTPTPEPAAPERTAPGPEEY